MGGGFILRACSGRAEVAKPGSVSLGAGVSITFAFVLANKCAVLVWLAFHTQVFFILTVTVYLDTVGCVVAELLSEWNKRFFLLAGVTGSRCTK